MLNEIVSHKRREVAARRSKTVFGALTPSQRSLADALSGPSVGYILECKKRSPSKGLLRDPYEPATCASVYEAHGNAISVITDERYFGGSLENLREVRAAVDLPVLLKDFVIDPFQVKEARAAGADAVLLMLSVLDDPTAAACLDVCEALNVDALVEVHTEEELERALALNAKILGINSRDLHTLETNFDTLRRLAPRIPTDRILVGESGIRDHRDVVELRSCVDAFLVGSSLMSQPDLDRACRELIYGRVKICGLTRPEDAVSAYDAGATEAGLVFAADSPRCVGRVQALAIRQAANLAFVGVFVNAPIREVVAIASALELLTVQLHGSEDEDYIRRLRAHLPEGCRIRRAVRIEGTPSFGKQTADELLLDSFHPDLAGGTGLAFDWKKIPDDRADLILAGGLATNNIGAADELGVAALDVASGVEQLPGVKCGARMKKLFDALRGSGRRGGASCG